jgi:hypothetical protein
MPKRKPFRLQRYDITKRFSTVSGSTYFDTSDPNDHLILWARAANKDPVPLVAEDASTQDHTVTFFAGGGSDADGSKNQEARTTPFSEDSFANITSPVRFLKSADAYVKVADADDLSFGDGSSDSSFSLATWVLITSASATTGLIEKGLGTGAAPNEYRIFYHDGGLTGSISDVSASAELNFVADTAALFTENSWHHVAFTYNSAITKTARGRFYLNGNFVTGSCTEAGTYVAMEPGSADLRLASNKDNQPVEFFEAAIWSGKVLTAEEINALYNAEGGLVDVVKDRVYIKTSGITSLPPRPYLHTTDNATGSYPPTYRMGDARSGYFTGSFTSDKRYVISATPFDDNDAIRFHGFGGSDGLTGNVILGQQLSTFSKFTGSLVANTNLVPDLTVTSSQTSVVPGISDSRVRFTPGVDYKPYIEDFNESLGRMSTNDPFWATGSAVSEVGPGFSMPVWSKTKLEIDIDPVETTKVYWSTGSLASAQPNFSTDVAVSSGLYYYNFDLKRFEAHGNLTAGTNVDYYNDDVDFVTGSLLAFNPSRAFTDFPIRGFEGNPVNTAGFPFDLKFNATSSQHFDTSQLIQHPFLVEKMVYEFSGSLPYIVTSTNKPMITQFFIMNEMNYPVSGDQPGNPTRIISGTFRNGVSSPRWPEQRFIVNKPRDLVTYTMMSTFDGTTVSNDLNSPAEENGFARDLNVLVTSAVNAPTGTFVMSASLRSPVAVDGMGHIQARTASTNDLLILRNQFGGRTGTGRAVNGLISPRSFTDTVAAITPSSSFTPSSATYATVRVTKKLNEISPYLLLPGDKLIFGWANQQQPTRNSDNTSEMSLAGRGGAYSSKEDGRLTIAPGRGKVTLYGSVLRRGKEFHNGINQNLTSDAVHEDVKSSDRFSNADCIDQVDTDYRFSLTGSYTDLAFTQVEGREFGVPASRIGFRPNSVLGGKAGTTGSIIRGLALIDTNERYQDSFFPDPVEIARVNEVSFVADDSGSPKFGSPRYVMYPLGPEVDAVLDAPADLRWPRAFPFESDYGALEFENRVSRASRVLNATNFSGVAVDSNSIFGDPVSTITGRNTSAQATNELFALMNIGGSGAGSPPVDARKLFLKSFFGIGDAVNGNPRIVKNVSDHAVSNFNGGNDVELRGFKYGLYNVVPAFTRAIYRRDRYGQFRDMLEQRALTAFEPFQYQIPNTRDLQGGEPQTVNTLEQPVTIQFKKTNATGVGDELRIELLDSEDFTKIETNNGTSGDRRAVWNQGCNVDRFSRVIKPFFDANPIFQIFDATQQNDDDEDSALILTLAE